MVNTRYHLIILYSEDGTPINCTYVRNHLVVATKTIEHTGDIIGEAKEYYCEYDKLGVFVYTKDNKIIKSRTWVQDFKIEGCTTDYKPLTTVKFIKEQDFMTKN
jgi:hypothetical protein